MISDKALWQHRIKMHIHGQATHMNNIVRSKSLEEKLPPKGQIGEPSQNSRNPQRNLPILTEALKITKNVPKRKLLEDNFKLKMIKKK